MSQKELLYLEDAVNHERIIISFLEEVSSKCEEEDFFLEEIDRHEGIYEDLMNLLKEKSYEW